MASYKVLQDIEAEDTLIGPLTLRQCIYAAIAVGGGYLSFIVISKGAPYLAVFFLPFVVFGVFFAFPWSKQQTTEIWALAKIRFYLKPRTRIWNQSGVKQLVTITAPKKITKRAVRNLSPIEVQSRLRALADTIDSRGWATKNIELGYYPQPSLMGATDSDRLIDPNAMPQEVPNFDADAAADIFDTANNPVAHKFDALMSQSANSHHEQLVQQMTEPAAPPAAPYWHMKTIQPPVHSAIQPDADTQSPTGRSQRQRPVQRPVDYLSMRTPGGGTQAVSAAPNDDSQSAAAPVTDLPDPAILELANNNDLNVATLAREAQARTAGPNDEVVVSLH